MLFATTRSKTDTYTAHRTLHQDKAPNGGFFIPYRMPVLDRAQILKMKDQSFSASVAQILNLFYATQLTSWDVDCCIGKNAVKIIAINQKVFLTGLWDNAESDYEYIQNQLYSKLCSQQPESQITDWAKISIRIAVLFGMYSLLQQYGVSSFDISVNSGDFSLPMAVWYARYMGLPVGMIICACNENNGPWDFLHRGEMNTALSTVTTEVPELDVANPPSLERLIYATLGFDEAKKYIDASAQKGVYRIHPDMMQALSRGMFVSVIGKGRPESVITSVYKSADCILDPYTAVSFGALQDYRAKTGENCPTVLLWDRSPVKFLPVVQSATGLMRSEIEKKIISG